jgi:hypothetical protein
VSGLRRVTGEESLIGSDAILESDNERILMKFDLALLIKIALTWIRANKLKTKIDWKLRATIFLVIKNVAAY